MKTFFSTYAWPTRNNLLPKYTTAWSTVLQSYATAAILSYTLYAYRAAMTT